MPADDGSGTETDVSEKAPTGGPPRLWVLIADWCNVIAGIVLTMSFLEGALLNSVKMQSLLNSSGIPTPESLGWLKRGFCTEGVLYAFAELFMVGVMAATPPQLGGGPVPAMQFAILMAGGVFFSLSGFVFPPCITNVTYVFSGEACNHPAAAQTPYVWNAMAHFGITCFMIGTSIGLKGVMPLPKKPFIGPFWGCAMYFAGAWTIGIFKFWGPVLLGGFNPAQNAEGFDFTAPSVTMVWTWWFGMLGAIFLATGAGIFLIMNKSVTC